MNIAENIRKNEDYLSENRIKLIQCRRYWPVQYQMIGLKPGYGTAVRKEHPFAQQLITAEPQSPVRRRKIKSENPGKSGNPFISAPMEQKTEIFRQIDSGLLLPLQYDGGKIPFRNQNFRKILSFRTDLQEFFQLLVRRFVPCGGKPVIDFNR